MYLWKFQFLKPKGVEFLFTLYPEADIIHLVTMVAIFRQISYNCQNLLSLSDNISKHPLIGRCIWRFSFRQIVPLVVFAMPVDKIATDKS